MIYLGLIGAFGFGASCLAGCASNLLVSYLTFIFPLIYKIDNKSEL